MHECMLCKKDMKKSRNQFGTGCINNVYEFLDINEKVKRKDREEILYKTVMERTNILRLNKKQKIWLTDRYLTYQYLNKLPYGNFEDLKKEIYKDIKRMASINKLSEIQTMKKLSLKSAYTLYKREQKFRTTINKFKNENNFDDEKLKLLITSLSFIFNYLKHKDQYEINAFRSMQFAFWQLVIEIGGKYFNFNTAARLLNHSLEENPDDLLITEGNILQTIEKNNDFKNKMNDIITKYGKQKKFNLEQGKEYISFKNSDLYFALHHADIIMSASQNADNTWKLDITLSDPYDYTKLKKLKDYYFDTENIFKSFLSSTLYNFAYISMKFGVMKEYNIVVKLKIDNYEVE